MIRKWKLPKARDFGWNMKPLDSAKTEFLIDPTNMFILRIEHDTLKGITPEMLLWWFQNIGGEMMYHGKSYPRYLVWHPKDHIQWSLVKNVNGSVGKGSYFRIVEAFEGNMNYLIDSIELVEKLDLTGIRLVRRFLGIEVFSLQHDFIQQGQNTKYISTMKVGTNKKPFNMLFNFIIRPLIFTKEMGKAWLKHNIEEVGNFEFFLSDLYLHRNQ